MDTQINTLTQTIDEYLWKKIKKNIVKDHKKLPNYSKKQLQEKYQPSFNLTIVFKNCLREIKNIFIR